LTRSFSIGSTPTDVAIGAGSVWVGSAFRAADYGNYPRSISRLDPVSGRTQETIALPRHGATGYFQGGGFSQQHIAATDSAVWAINPDATISRIDPRTNRRVATVRKVEVRSLAAGRRGVWGVTETGVVEIDPRRNVVARKVAIPAPSLLGIALGGGAVWVSDPFGGSVWRVDPEAKQQRQIPLDLGVRSIAFGNGALWVASEIGDKVYKIDPSTNKARVVNRLVAPQQVAIGEGGVWVTALGPPRGAETLPGGVCSPAITRAGSRPDVLIASDLPLQGSADTPTTLPMVAAIRFLLEQRGFKAGRHTVGYQSCDDSTAQAAGFDIFRCFANGKAYARDLHVVGVVGAYQSFCSSVEIPVANQAPGGPLAMVSPSNTLTFITRRDPSLPPNQLAALYPTGIRNYARIAPSYDLWAAAMPQAAQQLGKKRVYVLWDRRDADFTSFATIMRNSARKLGLDVVGAAGWDANAGSFAALARRVRAARPEALLLSGTFPRHSPAFFEALRAELGRGVLLIGNDGFGVPDMLHHLGPVTDGMYIVNYGRANAELPASGRRFLRLFGSATGRKAPDLSAAYSAAAAEVLLDAIARSDGTRASVTRQLLRTRIEDGIAGPVAFDRNGDLLHAPLTLSRWTGREMRPERVITVG
jgi:branched-chain amino acid transport system substrate-binding protein